MDFSLYPQPSRRSYLTADTIPHSLKMTKLCQPDSILRSAETLPNPNLTFSETWNTTQLDPGHMITMKVTTHRDF